MPKFPRKMQKLNIKNDQKNLLKKVKNINFYNSDMRVIIIVVGELFEFSTTTKHMYKLLFTDYLAFRMSKIVKNI